MPKDIIHNSGDQDFNAGFIAGIKASDHPCTISAWLILILILILGGIIGWALASYANVLGG